MVKDVLKPGFALFAIAFVMVGILAVINAFTKDIIAESNMSGQQLAILEVVPEVEGADLEETVVNFLQEDNAGEFTAEGEKIYSYYEYILDDELLGYGIVSEGIGYGGAIRVAVGIDTEGVITGIKLVGHEETPGLGAKAEDPTFTDKFLGKSGQLKLVASGTSPGESEIDSITAATITSQGVVDAVNNATGFFDTNLKGAE